MKIRTGAALVAAAWLFPAAPPARGGIDDRPNIVVILSDDQGYADVSYNPRHPREVSTPNIDALAKAGVVCTAGYTTGNVCSPTRAGLMTGRYQQRCGIYTAGEGGSGLPLKETLFPQYLKEGGYVSGALGKWHLGLTPEYNAVNRGFDSFYGFMGRGAHDYYKLSDPDDPIYRDLQTVDDRGYLTTRITEEAVSFISKHKDRPFFLYVAYNAVHSPPQAPEEDIRRFDTGDPARDVLMAMLLHLDAGVGEIVGALKKAGLYENTLLFYLTDNGGSKAMHAVNAPLRGFKQQNYEGGIRVPFIVSWPARLPAGASCTVPVTSLDILPTALAAAGIPLPEDRPFDGKNLLPALKGEVQALHETLFWSEGGSSGEWAVRAGKWKLVAHKDVLELFDLESDIGETTDLAAKLPDQVRELKRRYDAWLDTMAEPLHGPGKRWGSGTGEAKPGKKRRKGDEGK